MADAIELERAITWEAVRYQFKLASTKGTGVTLKNPALKRLLCDTLEMLTKSTTEERHEDAQSGLLKSMTTWSEVCKIASSDAIHEFTPAEVKIWVKCLDREYGKFKMRVGGLVQFWVNYESASPDHDGHPLDFDYDPMHDYSPGLTFEAGMYPEELALCDAITIDDTSKAYFFHIIATIEKLEACKAKRVEAKLSSTEASSIWMVIRCFLRLRLDLISKWRSQPNHPRITASMRIADAAKSSQSLSLTRDEVRQVLLNCQVVSRPKPKGHPQDPNLQPKKAISKRKREDESQVDSPESIRASGVESDCDSADAHPTLRTSSSPARNVPSEKAPILQSQYILPMPADDKADSIAANKHGLMSDVDGNVAATEDYEEMQTVTATTTGSMTEEAVPTCANEITEHDPTLSEDHSRMKNSKNVCDSVSGSGVGHTESVSSESSYHSTEKITSGSCQDIEEVSNKVLSLVPELQPENEVSPDHHAIGILQHLLVGIGQNTEYLHEQVKEINVNAERIKKFMQESHERDLEEEKARCAMKIEEHEKSLEKKLSDVKEKAAEDLRSERAASARLKQSFNQKISGSEKQLQTSKAAFEKAQVAITKRQSQLSSALSKAQEEAGSWEKKYDEQVALTSVLQSDYDYTVSELETLRLKNEKASQKRDEKLHALEQELAVLRSKRTNPQVEQDKITNAVRNATHDMRIEVVKAHAELEKKQFEVHGLKTELDQTKADLKFAWEHVTEDPPSLKEKDDIIASLEEQLAKAKLDTENATALGGSHHYVAMEVSRLEGELAAEQEKSSRLEHALRSASDLLDSIQTMTTQVNGIVTSAGWSW